MMKKILMTLLVLASFITSSNAANLSDLTWAQVCSGNMGASWYGSTESQELADLVLEVQKNNGGWMKNDQLHKLTSAEYTSLTNSRGAHSCLDNYATTQEMRFLAKVYQGCKVEKYKTAFNKALTMIFNAEKSNGGWSQYWPLSGSGSYQDYITFNDDLMTNVMKILRDIYENKGDFIDITDEATRTKCQEAFDRGLSVIIKCQIDDNGTPAAWCAQHDPTDFLPTEGRPHELPSVSGAESASLLSFLMTVENPSEELQTTITTAIDWLKNHPYMTGKAIEDYTNASGVADRHIVDKANSAIWGRFIQIGGESGKTIYNKFFTKLKNRNKSRSYTYNGTKYTYTEYEIATSSYDESKAYQPIYAIYTDEYPHLFYRFLYNYDDTDPVVDSKGLPIATSLTAGNRRSYQYLGSWCYNTIYTEYPAWKQKMDIINNAGDATPYEISKLTYKSSTSSKYDFTNDFAVTNTGNKGYGTGSTNTIKYSAGTDYAIVIPEGLQVTKVTFYGYSNYDSDSYISKLGSTTYNSTDYVFPAKASDGTATFVTNTIDLSDAPASGTLPFKIGSKQTCLVITVYAVSADGIESATVYNASTGNVVKKFENGRVIIEKANNTFLADGKAE